MDRPTVFISYSHDSPEHAARAWAGRQSGAWRLYLPSRCLQGHGRGLVSARRRWPTAQIPPIPRLNGWPNVSRRPGPCSCWTASSPCSTPGTRAG